MPNFKFYVDLPKTFQAKKVLFTIQLIYYLMQNLLKISYMVFNEFAHLAQKIFNGIQYLFIQQYLYLFIYWVNAVAKKMSFHFFFHQYFCSNCRKPNYRYNDNLYVQEQPGWVHIILILRYSEIDIFNHIILYIPYARHYKPRLVYFLPTF